MSKKDESADYFPTLHALMENLTEYLGLTPEQKFRVAAKIKRHVHAEKHNLTFRLHEYCRGPGIYDEGGNKIGEFEPQDKFISDTLYSKMKTHAEWARKPDEEVLTFDMGSHVYDQPRPPCQDCGVDLTSRESVKKLGGLLTLYSKEGVKQAYCKPCADKNGKWAEFEAESRFEEEEKS